MQYKLGVGDQLDLSYQLGENEEDMGVSYSIPEAQQVVATVSASGVVTALTPGVVVVTVTETSSGAELDKVVVSVLTDTQLEALELEARGLIDVDIDINIE